jgi:hypothetical protein
LTLFVFRCFICFPVIIARPSSPLSVYHFCVVVAMPPLHIPADPRFAERGHRPRKFSSNTPRHFRSGKSKIGKWSFSQFEPVCGSIHLCRMLLHIELAFGHGSATNKGGGGGAVTYRSGDEGPESSVSSARDDFVPSDWDGTTIFEILKSDWDRPVSDGSPD